MVETEHTGRLSDELANSRSQLRDSLLLLRRDLDVGRHIVHSMEGQTLEWVTVAFLSGWLLSRLSAHKKKIYYDSPDQEPGKEGSDKKKNKLWKMVWNTFKPVVAAYLAKEVADRVEKATIPHRFYFLGQSSPKSTRIPTVA
jgi:hypothetical protein